MLGKIIVVTTAGLLAQSHAIELSGTICGPSEEPVPGLDVTLLAPDSQRFVGTTDDAGRFVINVPDEDIIEGILTVDSIALVSGGFIIPELIPWDVTLPNQFPMIELEEITPELTFERRPDGTNCLRFNFDWVAGAVPETLRTYCVERSHNLLTWSTVMNVGMACPPVEFIDETVPFAKKCYYRIRPLAPITMSQIGIGQIGRIGDPTMMPPELQPFAPFWPNNIVLVPASEPLDPSEPIIAPEIRLTP